MQQTDPLILPNEELAAQIALAKCALAARMWFHRADGKSSSRSHALASLMSAMSWTRRAAAAEVAQRVSTPDRFLTLLSEPVSDWLPDCSHEPLVTSSRVTTFCEDLIEESGFDPDSELVQREIRQVRDNLRDKANGARLYSEFRRFVIENPVISRRNGPAKLLKFDVEPGKLYTDQIPSLAIVQQATGSCVFPCVRCSWPMERHGDRLTCKYAVCRKAGADFALNGSNGPRPLAGKDVPEGLNVGDVAILHRPIWRYTLLPGLAELELDESLSDLDGVDVELWPQFDRYDLHVKTSIRDWRVDVKDWSSAVHLATDLNRKDWSHTTWIVVPDHRQDQVRILKERCRSDMLEFSTCSGLIQSVKASIK